MAKAGMTNPPVGITRPVDWFCVYRASSSVRVVPAEMLPWGGGVGGGGAWAAAACWNKLVREIDMAVDGRESVAMVCTLKKNKQ